MAVGVACRGSGFAEAPYFGLPTSYARILIVYGYTVITICLTREANVTLPTLNLIGMKRCYRAKTILVGVVCGVNMVLAVFPLIRRHVISGGYSWQRCVNRNR